MLETRVNVLSLPKSSGFWQKRVENIPVVKIIFFCSRKPVLTIRGSVLTLR